MNFANLIFTEYERFKMFIKMFEEIAFSDFEMSDYQIQGSFEE